MMSNDSDQQKRIEDIFGNDQELSVTGDSMARYFDHLRENLSLPVEVLVKGEDTRYLLDGVQESGDELYGLLASIKEVENESKSSLIPLCDIKPVDNRSKNAGFLADYEYWFITYQ